MAGCRRPCCFMKLDAGCPACFHTDDDPPMQVLARDTWQNPASDAPQLHANQSVELATSAASPAGTSVQYMASQEVRPAEA